MITNISIPVLFVFLISTISFITILISARDLAKSGGINSKEFAKLLYGICMEITFATIALLFRDYEYVWVALRVGGRVIEIRRVTTFLNFLKIRNGKLKEND